MKEMTLYKISTIVGLIGIGVLFYMNYSTGNKVAYIDSIKLLEKYQGMVDARKKIEQQNSVSQHNVDTLVTELEQSMKKFEKDRANMSSKEIKLSEELLRSKQRQFLQYREAITNKTKGIENKITNEVLGKLNNYIKLYGEKNKIQVILGGNASGTVLYASNIIDITDKIIEEVNNEYK